MERPAGLLVIHCRRSPCIYLMAFEGYLDVSEIVPILGYFLRMHTERLGLSLGLDLFKNYLWQFFFRRAEMYRRQTIAWSKVYKNVSRRMVSQSVDL